MIFVPMKMSEEFMEILSASSKSSPTNCTTTFMPGAAASGWERLTFCEGSTAKSHGLYSVKVLEPYWMIAGPISHSSGVTRGGLATYEIWELEVRPYQIRKVLFPDWAIDASPESSMVKEEGRTSLKSKVEAFVNETILIVVLNGSWNGSMVKG